MNSKWKKLSEEKIFEHPRLTVYEDSVVLPDGHQTKYLRYSNAPDAASVIAINHEGKILLQKEYSYPPNEWLFQFPGGAIDSGESPLEGALRELGEEAGLRGDLTEIGWFYIDNRRKSTKFYMFTAQNLIEVPRNHDIEEAFEDFWVTEAEIDHMIRDGEIVTYSALAAWAIYKSTKQP